MKILNQMDSKGKYKTFRWGLKVLRIVDRKGLPSVVRLALAHRYRCSSSPSESDPLRYHTNKIRQNHTKSTQAFKRYKDIEEKDIRYS